MAAYELLLLNTSIPQIQAAQSGDTYLCPRELAVVVNTATDAVRITQTGTGNALLVEDSANPDSTPFVVTAAGNVGIGTDSPVSKLDVAETATIKRVVGGNNMDLNFYNGAAGTTQGNIARIRADGEGVSNEWGALSFWTGRLTAAPISEKMRLDSSGNLGLGVTPSAWLNTWKALQFGATGALAYSPDDTGYNIVSSNAFYDGAWKRIAAARSSSYSQNQGAHSWYTDSVGGSVGGATGWVQSMTLDASGNLGVGETSPSTYGKITLKGGKFSLVTDTATERRVSFWSTANGNSENAYIQVQNDGATTNTGEMLFATKNSGGTLAERARITSGGYFKASNDGTYINAAGSYHEFNSNAADDAFRIRNTSASTPYGIDINFSGASPDNNTQYFFQARDNAGGGTNRCIIWSDGDLANHDGVYGTISDQKLKQDIVDAGSQWNDIKAIRFRKYRMKTDVAINPDAPYLLGVVAQELEQVSPGLVDEHPDMETVEVTDEDGNVTQTQQPTGTTTKTVKSSILLMKAAVALQEAMARIEQLEAKVASLGA